MIELKLYRFAEKPLNQELSKEGWSNEYLNLEEYNKMSPSFRNSNYYEVKNEPNSFMDTRELSKYFYSSLVEAIMYTKYTQKKKLEMDVYCDYIIYEIDIDDELIKDYIGLGYYFGNENHIEFRIPYLLLYKILGINKDYIEESIKTYNEVNRVLLEEYTSSNSLLIQDIKDKGLYCDNTFSIYPLLCFDLKEKPKMLTLTRDVFESNGLYLINIFAKDLYRQREEVYDFQSNIKENMNDKNRLFQFANPIIKEENEELKLLLKHGKYTFK